MGNWGFIMVLKKMFFILLILKNVVFVVVDVEWKDFDEMVCKVKMGDSWIDDV